MKKKNLKAIRGSTTRLIKTLISEISTVLYKRLNIVGVGYRGFSVDKYEKKLLLLKLGYSHPVYFRIPENLMIFCLKFTKLFIYGNSYQNISLMASLLKKTKLPEPYKGKGILNENERLILKQGKKI
jgi:large subunit ribosomal protein L6